MRLRRIRKFLAAGFLIGFALVVTNRAMISRIQNRLTFFPAPFSGNYPEDPSHHGLRYEDIFIETPDGEKLHAWYAPHPKALTASIPTLFFLHGNGGNIGGRAFLMPKLVELGVNAAILDYRGYGKSTGEPSEKGLFIDALAFYDRLVELKKIPADQIIVFGQSLGGAVATELATQRPVRKLILESTFSNARDVARAVYPVFPLRFFMLNQFNSLKRAEQLRMPKLVIHGDQDEIIPLALGQKLFTALPEPKEFYLVAHGSHNDVSFAGGEAYWQKLHDFIASPSPASKNP